MYLCLCARHLYEMDRAGYTVRITFCSTLFFFCLICQFPDRQMPV